MSRKRQERRREEQRQRRQREQHAAKQSEAAKQLEVAQLGLGAAINSSSIDLSHKAAPAPPIAPPPVFSECVIGYRHWLLDVVGQLRAITMTKQIWQPGINTARCRPNDHAQPGWISSVWGAADEESHAAPGAKCHCGLYGWNDFPTHVNGHGEIDPSGRLLVLGAIAAWGDLRVHHTGFRASHACIVALAYADQTPARVRERLLRVGAEYRVPLVHVDTLQAEAERHGTPLPMHVRPEPLATWLFSHTYVIQLPKT